MCPYYKSSGSPGAALRAAFPPAPFSPAVRFSPESQRKHPRRPFLFKGERQQPFFKSERQRPFDAFGGVFFSFAMQHRDPLFTS